MFLLYKSLFWNFTLKTTMMATCTDLGEVKAFSCPFLSFIFVVYCACALKNIVSKECWLVDGIPAMLRA